MNQPKFAYCTVSVAPLRAEKKDASEMVTQLLFGEVVRIMGRSEREREREKEKENSTDPWCEIITEKDSYHGYADTKHLRILTEDESTMWLKSLTLEKNTTRLLETPWGNQLIYKGSFVARGEQFTIGQDRFTFVNQPSNIEFNDPFACAVNYLNTPYLWGGKTPFGIDCSGLTQMVFRFFHKELPRDASQQVNSGQAISFEKLERNDLVFFSNPSGKIIHVGIAGDNGQIIHASGQVRIDQLTDKGIIHSVSKKQTHKLASIRRI